MTSSDALPRHGTRVSLRRLSAADLDAFQSYRHDDEVGRYQGWTPWPDRKSLTFLESMGEAELFQPERWCQIGIADRESRELIGDIGLCVRADENEAEMGFSLSTSWQGRGLGTEAVRLAVTWLFECTKIDRLVCITDTRNVAATGLLRRLGMELVQTEEAVFRGEPCSEHRFLLSRNDDLPI